MSAHPLFSLLEAMKQGALVITPNKRLSHTLIELFLKTYGTTTQVHPRCLPYQTFLHLCYDLTIQQHARLSHPLLLNNAQTKFMWDIVGQTLPHTERGLSKEMFSAWKLCKTWHLDLDHPLFNQSSHTQLFQTWGKAFDEILLREHFITEQTLVAYLSTIQLNFPYTQVIFACFDDFNPAQLDFRCFLQRQHLTTQLYDLPHRPQQTFLFEAPDDLSELNALRQWLLLKQEQQETVAVLVPNLEKRAMELKRWFQFYFPGTPIHFSLGQPLCQYPLIYHALNLISLNHETLTREQAQLLLHSAFIEGSDIEKELRGVFSIQDGALKSRFLNASFFLKNLAKSCPILYKKLSNISSYPQQASPAQWANLFMQKLIEWGFPGPFPLNSENYQAFERLKESLLAFKTFSCIQTHLTQSDALHYFEQLIQQTLFQPEQPPQAGIHVLGLLEASGSPYSSIWIMGLSDKHFPNLVSPTSFIPLKLQQIHRLPHTDLQQEFSLAKLRLQRFQHASQELIVSYPKTSQDSANRPSVLIDSFPKYSLDLVTTSHGLFSGSRDVTRYFDSAGKPRDVRMEDIEWYQDPVYLPLRENEKRTHGSQILSEQAKCGFRAFATARLHGKALDCISTGLDAKTRGIFLHKVLELFWREIKNKTKLHQLQDDTLRSVIQQCIQMGIKQLPAQEAFSSMTTTLEIERMEQLLLASLAWEKERPHYEVEALEKKYEVQLGPLTFKIRLDRLDQLHPEEKWVIDYKTSMPSPLPWNEDTPLEPQLLLYALIDPAVRVILFHELKKGRTQIKGLSADDYSTLSLSPLKKNEAWEEKTSIWKNYILKLADSFFNGDCATAPKVPELCRSCDYASLCRHPLL